MCCRSRARRCGSQCYSFLWTIDSAQSYPAWPASGDVMPMSKAVKEFPKACVRISEGRRSVPGMRPCTRFPHWDGIVEGWKILA